MKHPLTEFSSEEEYTIDICPDNATPGTYEPIEIEGQHLFDLDLTAQNVVQFASGHVVIIQGEGQ